MIMMKTSIRLKEATRHDRLRLRRTHLSHVSSSLFSPNSKATKVDVTPNNLSNMSYKCHTNTHTHIYIYIYIRKDKNTRLKTRAELATNSSWSEDVPRNRDNDSPKHLELGTARLVRSRSSD